MGSRAPGPGAETARQYMKAKTASKAARVPASTTNRCWGDASARGEPAARIPTPRLPGSFPAGSTPMDPPGRAGLGMPAARAPACPATFAAPLRFTPSASASPATPPKARPLPTSSPTPALEPAPPPRSSTMPPALRADRAPAAAAPRAPIVRSAPAVPGMPEVPGWLERAGSCRACGGTGSCAASCAGITGGSVSRGSSRHASGMTAKAGPPSIGGGEGTASCPKGGCSCPASASASWPFCERARSALRKACISKLIAPPPAAQA